MSGARTGHRRARGVRRSPYLVAYWRGGSLYVCNYATRQTVRATPFICDLLHACQDWRTPSEIQEALHVHDPALVSTLIQRLAAASLLEEEGRATDRRVRAMSVFSSWNPEAGFFHMATRDVRFSSPLRDLLHSRRRADQTPRPPAVKKYPRAGRVDLPRPRADGEFARVLRTRRTWRRYSPEPVTIHELGTLLGYTVGVHHWVDVRKGRLALKTSPSGGARHAIECYVAVRNVRGLRRGLYHYRADLHALERLKARISPARIETYVPGSEYFAGSSVMLFFTAVFERIMWRYPYSRAYRAALVEVGHVCQTFCLTATWLGLAPYCLLALADSLIERDLGLDGIREAVLYAAGAGRPPVRTSWAPLPGGGRLPIRPNPRV